MLWRGSADGWHLMLFEYVDARRVDLAPGSPDLPAVLDTLDLLGRLLTPGPNGALPITYNTEALQAKARHLLDTGRLADRELFEAALRGFSLDRLRGDTMLHYDLSAGNLLIAAGQVHVLDWSLAVRGAAWIDGALFAPRLVQAGHSPAQADLLLSRVPVWRAAPPDAVTALAALWALSRTRVAEAGRSWLLHRISGGT
jgi:Ser/Thr protein kinase RdoA (MazF antagonist)